MNTHTIIENPSMPVQPYAVDTSAGTVDGSVSHQWFSRPADQKFPDLNALFASKKAAYERSWEQRKTSREFTLLSPSTPTCKEDTHVLSVGLNVTQAGADVARHVEVAPTNWAFGQLCQLAKAPASYLRELPSQFVTEQLTYRLRYQREVEELKLYGSPEELFAATGPTYGRIPDYEVVDALRRIAGSGLGDNPSFHWKTPGKIDWSARTYDPENIGDVSDRTFYGSDRDLFVFLVDDRRPILVGKTRDGRDDYMFRGFYLQNSEVGSRSLKIKAFYLRGVCMNRNLWGCENFQELRINHTSKAPDRWVLECRPALESYAKASDATLIESVEKAKAAELADDDKSALGFLQKRCEFSFKTAKAIMDIHEKEEGAPARTAWDFAQGITAFARSVPNTDNRLKLEEVAGRILDKAA